MILVIIGVFGLDTFFQLNHQGMQGALVKVVIEADKSLTGALVKNLSLYIGKVIDPMYSNRLT